MDGFLEELCTWLNRDRIGRKVLFTRNLTTGRQLLRMAAAHGTPAVNVQAFHAGTDPEGPRQNRQRDGVHGAP